MKPVAFTYLRPESLDAALVMLTEAGDQAKVLAGGQSLVPMMNLRLVRPQYVVDINRLRELQYFREGVTGMEVGALARHQAIANHPLIRHRFPMIAEAVRWIGHTQIRARGTIGGSLVHADPSAEWPMVCTALEAKFVTRGPGGSQVLNAAEFFVTYMTTAVSGATLLTGVEFPWLEPNVGWSVQEMARRPGDFAIVAVTALLQRDAARRVIWGRIAVGGAGPVPVDASAAVASVMGVQPTLEDFGVVANAVQEMIDPDSDLHASAEYRRALVGVLTKRALKEAWSRSLEKEVTR